METPPQRGRGIASNGEGESRPCRVEHRVIGEAPRVLARLDDCVPHFHTLTPFAIHLALVGEARGELVLIDEATGEVLARRNQARPVRRTSQFGRP